MAATKDRMPAGNSRFAKAGVPYFYDSEVQNSSLVHLMKFSTKNPRLRKAAKRYLLLYSDTPQHNRQWDF